jgi:hypothetical protein
MHSEFYASQDNEGWTVLRIMGHIHVYITALQFMAHSRSLLSITQTIE